jgi:hypothetical protein
MLHGFIGLRSFYFSCLMPLASATLGPVNMSSDTLTEDAVKKDIISNLVTPKANACPMGVRLAW